MCVNIMVTLRAREEVYYTQRLGGGKGGGGGRICIGQSVCKMTPGCGCSNDQPSKQISVQITNTYIIGVFNIFFNKGHQKWTCMNR